MFKKIVHWAEKILVDALKCCLIQQSATVEFREVLCGHVRAHVQLDANLICTWHNKISAVCAEKAEIGEDDKSLRLNGCWKKKQTAL